MDSTTKYLLGLLTVVLTCTVCTGLQCYQCRGITHMDENGCIDPVYGKTTQQECPRGDACEKRIKKIDKHHSVIERGCSANCDGRDYIWTMDFMVHCCDDSNLCNTATTMTGYTSMLSLCVLLASVFLFLRL